MSNSNPHSIPHPVHDPIHDRFHVNWSTGWDGTLCEPSGSMRCIGTADTPRVLQVVVNSAILSRRRKNWGDGFLSVTDREGVVLTCWYFCGEHTFLRVDLEHDQSPAKAITLASAEKGEKA